MPEEYKVRIKRKLVAPLTRLAKEKERSLTAEVNIILMREVAARRRAKPKHST